MVCSTSQVIVLFVNISEKGGSKFYVSYDELSGEFELGVFDHGLREADHILDLPAVDVVGREVVHVQLAPFELRVLE